MISKFFEKKKKIVLFQWTQMVLKLERSNWKQLADLSNEEKPVLVQKTKLNNMGIEWVCLDTRGFFENRTDTQINIGMRGYNHCTMVYYGDGR